MEFRRLGAQEEARANLLVGQPICGQQRDLKLPRGQLVDQRRVAWARRLPARPQFLARHIGPRGRSYPIELVQGRAKLLASLDAWPGAPEPLAPEELGTRALEPGHALGAGEPHRVR